MSLRWTRMAAKNTKRHKRRVGVWALLPVAVVAFVFCRDTSHAALKSFEEYRAIYEKKTSAIEAMYLTAKTNALSSFARGLMAAKEYYRKKGDLDGITAVKNEMDRFGKDRRVPKEFGPQAPDVLIKLGMVYRKKVVDAQKDRDRQTVAMVRQYSRALDTLKRELVRKEELDQARRVADEIKRVTFIASEAELRLRSGGMPANGNGFRLPANLQKGLVLYYSFDEVEDGKVPDQAGNDHGAIVRGARWVEEGLQSGAYEFDGRDDSVSGPGGADFANMSHTVAAWVKSQPSSGIQGIAGYWGRGGSQAGYGLVITAGGKMALIEGNGNKWQYAVSDDLLRGDGEWHHVVGVRQNRGFMVYVDGKRQEHDNRFSPSFPKDAGFRIGLTGYPGQAFKGMIDEVMVYSRALTSREVAQLYGGYTQR